MTISFYNLQTHARVVVRAFPETCMVIVCVSHSVSVNAPVPFSKVVVYEMLLDVLPQTFCFMQCFLVAEVLVQVVEPHYCFCLHPPYGFAVLKVKSGE